MANNYSRPFTFHVLLALILFQGISGVVGGLGLVFDPTGETLQIPIAWLDDSPFSDYSIPGWILLIGLGFFPLVVVFGLWRQWRGAWFGATIVGAALIVWIAVEIMIIGYHTQPPLQLIYGSVGLLILVLVYLPPVRKSLDPLQRESGQKWS